MAVPEQQPQKKQQEEEEEEAVVIDPRASVAGSVEVVQGEVGAGGAELVEPVLVAVLLGQSRARACRVRSGLDVLAVDLGEVVAPVPHSW